jgi:restriction system protein
VLSTAEAVAYADRVAARVVLIDSQALSGLMVHHNIGMQDEHTYAIKWIDEDFFDES